jgi:hypothetical protein
MRSVKSTEEDFSRFGLLNSAALWSMAARQTRLSLETQAALLRNYENVFTAWLRHRQQDVAEGLRTCEEISDNPDASNALVTYQQWTSACMNRWAEDIKVLGDSFVSMASRVQDVGQEAVTELEASQDTARTEAAKHPAR